MSSVPLSELRMLPVTGDKVVDFLQGYLTCDCTTISNTTLTPWALCNLKGRVVANGWAASLPDGAIGLILEASLVERVATTLTPYARFHRCQLDVDASQAIQISAESQAAGWPLDDWSLYPAAEGQSDASATQFFSHLIEQRLPVVSAAVTEQFLPQVLNLVEHKAVDFDKGCYLGQEIVARAQFRGAVKKQLQTFKWADSTPPAIGSAYKTDSLAIECVVNLTSWPSETPDTLSGIGLGVTRA